MKVYTKQVVDGEVVGVVSYDFTPDFGDDPNTVCIEEEEYNALIEEFKSKIPKPEPDPNKISDRKALEIITGGEV